MVHTFKFSCYNTIKSKASRHQYQMHPPVCYWCAGAPRFTKVGIFLNRFTMWAFLLYLYHDFGSIYFLSHYFLLHNVRIKRYFSRNLIPTNYSALCSSRNFIICLYIYSIKATLQIIHPKSGHPYFYQILMVSIPVYSFLHKKTS